jgi:hypothetical protein
VIFHSYVSLPEGNHFHNKNPRNPTMFRPIVPTPRRPGTGATVRAAASCA